MKDLQKGNNIGDICPICEQALLVFSGGCNTCPACHSQLKCGL